MKKKIFITLLTAGSLLSSCQKQILDVDQLDVINLEQYYSNLTDPKAESLIASVYKTAYGVTNNNWYNMMHGYTDDCVGGGGFATALNSSNHTSSSFYTTLYYLNYECNLIIENMSEDSAVKKQVMGEVLRPWPTTYSVQVSCLRPMEQLLNYGDTSNKALNRHTTACLKKLL